MPFGPRVFIGDLDVTAAPYLLEVDYDLGNGVTIYDELTSLLRDGTLVTSSKTGNRTLRLPILVEDATGSRGRAEAGVALDVEANKPYNTVTVYPHDYGQPGAGPAMVLESFEMASEVDPDVGGRLERVGIRRYVLTCPALPGVRSVDPVTVNWSGPGAVLRAVDSTTGWTSRSGGGTLSVSSGALTRTTSGPLLLRTTPTNPLREFVYIRSNAVGAFPLNMVIGGAAITEAEVYKGPAANNADVMLVEVPEQFIGATPQIDFDIEVSSGTAILYGFGTTRYPNIPVGAEPGGAGINNTATSANFGIGSIEVVGTARTFCTISFTAPSGGAFVVTGRDPVHALRTRGLAEIAFGKFTVASSSGATVTVGSGVTWFPQGTHYTQVGVTNPQPPQLNPNGMWPQLATGTTTLGGDSSARQFAYPADEMAAVTFFATSGPKTLISAQQDLPDGYTGGAEVFEDHILHPGRSMFAVLDQNGDPIPATITYYPRWRHFPTQ